jgi:hypothetical protein
MLMLWGLRLLSSHIVLVDDILGLEIVVAACCISFLVILLGLRLLSLHVLALILYSTLLNDTLSIHFQIVIVEFFGVVISIHMCAA